MYTFTRDPISVSWSPEIIATNRDDILHVITTFGFLLSYHQNYSALEFANLIDSYTDHPKGKYAAALIRGLSGASYYEQLSEPVLKHLKSYQSDFIKHDKAILEQYPGSFIIGYRSTGTNIVVFNRDYLYQCGLPVFNPEDASASMETFDVTMNAFLFANERYFIGENGVIRSTSEQEARQYLEQKRYWLTQIIRNKAA